MEVINIQIQVLKRLTNNMSLWQDTCKIQFHKIEVKYAPLDAQLSSNLSILDKNIKTASKPVKPDQYLNIWVADIANGLLGYAQIPWEGNPDTDV